MKCHGTAEESWQYSYLILAITLSQEYALFSSGMYKLHTWNGLEWFVSTAFGRFRRRATGVLTLWT